MTDREHIRELYVSYLNGDIDDASIAELHGHLERDKELRLEILADLEVHGLLGQLKTDGDAESFHRAFMERLRAEGKGEEFLTALQESGRMAPGVPGAAIPRRTRYAWRWSVAVAAGVVIAVAAFLLGRSQPATDSTVATAFKAELMGDGEGVVVKRGADSVDAKPGVPVQLQVGDGIETATRASGRILCDEGKTRLKLSSNGSCEVVSNDPGKTFKLLRGTIDAEVVAQPSGRPLRIVTPHAVAEVLGTRFALSVDAIRSVLDVQRGRVRFSMPHGRTDTVVTRDHYAKTVGDGNTARLETGKRLVLQDGLNGYTGTRDTFISRYDPQERHNPQGALIHLKLFGQVRKLLIHFDLSPIPADAEIHSAALELRGWFSEIPGGSADDWVRVCRMTRSWEEGPASTRGRTPGATWDEWRRTDRKESKKGDWTDGGAEGDYEREPYAAVSEQVLRRGVDFNVRRDLAEPAHFEITRLVRGWVDGTWPNHGMLIRTDGQHMALCFWSREYKSPHGRPRLVIRYSPRSGR